MMGQKGLVAFPLCIPWKYTPGLLQHGFRRIHVSSGFSCSMMLVIKANAKAIVDSLDHILC